MKVITWSVLSALLLVGTQVVAEPWARHTIDASSQGADGARLGDFNGDGLVDIVTPWEEGGAIRIAFHPGVGRVKEPWPSVEIGRVGTPEDAVAMDVDGDGRLDVVSACEGNTRSIYVHWAPKKKEDLMNPMAWCTEVLPASEGKMPFMFSVPMDVNQDGRMDLVSGGKNKGAALGWFEAPKHPRNLSAWEWHEIMPLGWLMSLQVIPLDDQHPPTLMMSDRRGTLRGVYWIEAINDRHPNTSIAKKSSNISWRRLNLGGQEQEVMFADVEGDPITDKASGTLAWAVTKISWSPASMQKGK